MVRGGGHMREGQNSKENWPLTLNQLSLTRVMCWASWVCYVIYSLQYPVRVVFLPSFYKWQSLLLQISNRSYQSHIAAESWNSNQGLSVPNPTVFGLDHSVSGQLVFTKGQFFCWALNYCHPVTWELKEKFLWTFPLFDTSIYNPITLLRYHLLTTET